MHSGSGVIINGYKYVHAVVNAGNAATMTKPTVNMHLTFPTLLTRKLLLFTTKLNIISHPKLVTNYNLIPMSNTVDTKTERDGTC